MWETWFYNCFNLQLAVIHYIVKSFIYPLCFRYRLGYTYIYIHKYYTI